MFLEFSDVKRRDFLFSIEKFERIEANSLVFGCFKSKFSIIKRDFSFTLCDNADFLAKSLTFLFTLFLYSLGSGPKI